MIVDEVVQVQEYLRSGFQPFYRALNLLFSECFSFTSYSDTRLVNLLRMLTPFGFPCTSIDQWLRGGTPEIILRPYLTLPPEGPWKHAPIQSP